MKIALLKLSGKALEKFSSDGTWAGRINTLKKKYDGVIIVHGAGTTISDWSKKLECEVDFVNGQRVTNEAIMDVVAAVQAGLLNHKLIAYLETNGIESLGLSGIDRGLFVADYLNPELGFVGYPRATGSSKWIVSLLKDGVVPVFSSVCRDTEGNLMNVNADVFAERLAEFLKAETVMFLSDVDGVKINGEVQTKMNEDIINSGITNGDITGGMIPKLESCIKLLNNGVRKIWIGSESAFSDDDNDSYNDLFGTWIVNERA